jgi:branched-chain amino acid transport system ATP-binding protein
MPTSAAEGGLALSGVTAGYGGDPVVRGVGVTVPRGSVVALVGPNGSGKSTLLKAVAGAVPVSAGSVVLDGTPVTNRPRHLLARQGLVYVPQENEVFASLTVRENLEIGAYTVPRHAVPAAVSVVLERFPSLTRRLSTMAGDLSGGERRTLAIARTLLRRPVAVLLDEPSAGLDPTASEELLSSTVPALAAQGAAVLLVEQRVRSALAIADHAYVMVAGAVALEGTGESVAAHSGIGALFLGGR